MKRLLSYYNLKLPIYLTYMYQQVEYNPNKFLAWIFKLPDLTTVIRRQRIVWTTKARLLGFLLGIIYFFYIALAVWYFILSLALGIFTILITPPLVVVLSYMIVLLGWLNYEEPRRRKLLKRSAKIFKEHPGITIAIAGSYGKTSMKEILLTVLGSEKKVVATPGNKNVPVSHAAWAKKLSGDEEILLVEYGEGAPGDIKILADLTHPDYGIITGLAPNHLDEYKTLSAVAKDLLSLKAHVPKDQLFINTSGDVFKDYQINAKNSFSEKSVLGWNLGDIQVGLEGTSFVMKKDYKKINVHSQLIGEHHAAPLGLAAALGVKLGLSIKSVEKALTQTRAFEHRMQPKKLHGAWIIDDAYNGSLEGIRAGLQLLAKLPAKRKIYVTPGLVDQGSETERVHTEIGELISAAAPDKVVLMQNSTTQFILRGIEKKGYQGDLQIEADPLNFYSNLEHIIAAGDIVMLQNDWTDNYS